MVGFMVLFLSFILSIPITTFLHEMGHGLLAAWFTKKEVKIFLGTYGNTENNIEFSIGNFQFHIIRKLKNWRGGICIYQQADLKVSQNILILLGGPVLPLLIAGLFFYIVNIHYNDYAFLIASIFLGMCIVSFFYNLYPRKRKIQLADGRFTQNDGYSILQLYNHRKWYNEYNKALNFYTEQKYDSAAGIFVDIINKGIKDEQTYRLAVTSCIMSKNWTIAEPVINKFLECFEPSYLDFINIGYYYNNIDNNTLALECYHKSLSLKESWHALNNIGYSLNLLEEYKKAIEYFDRAMTLKSDSLAYTYNNRGLAKIKLGLTEDGLQDLQIGYDLDPYNAYYYKNLGTYHFDRKEYNTALNLFEKAKKMDVTVYKIDDDIEITKAYLTKIL